MFVKKKKKTLSCYINYDVFRYPKIYTTTHAKHKLIADSSKGDIEWAVAVGGTALYHLKKVFNLV